MPDDQQRPTSTTPELFKYTGTGLAAAGCRTHKPTASRKPLNPGQGDFDEPRCQGNVWQIARSFINS